MSFINELKRRNVVRVGIFYLVTAWLLIQIADVLVGLLGLPDWSLRLVGLLLLLGLPVALAFSWIYELTPEGIQRDRGTGVDATFSAGTGRKLNIATMAVAAVAIALVAWQQFGAAPAPPEPDAPIEAGSRSPSENQPAPAPDPYAPVILPPSDTTPRGTDAPPPTVAVLPFANLSADSENEYFADGVAEEVLNLIARSEQLRVISRSSAFSFKGQNTPIPEIADRLGASHVLEGSIRRAGDRIRVTVQLIDAGSDLHLWSETFDRKLTDIFAVQDEIAQAIARALSVELVGVGMHGMALDIYDLVLEARALASRRGDEEGLRRGVALLREATLVAPENAEAWGQLALAQMLLTNWLDRTADALALIRQYASRALTLDPENVAALTAMGSWQLFSFEFEAAEASFRKALAVNPNSVDAANWFGDYLVITNRIEEALVWEGLAARLDPLLAVHQLNLGFAHSQGGDSQAAIAAYRRALELDPGFGSAFANLMMNYFVQRDFAGLRDFEASYEGPLRDSLEQMLGLASLIEAGRMDEAEVHVRETSTSDVRLVYGLRMLHRNRSEEAWTLLAKTFAERDQGYPFYLWPEVAPTQPEILAQSEVYAEFWRTPPRDEVLRIRGHWIPTAGE